MNLDPAVLREYAGIASVVGAFVVQLALIITIILRPRTTQAVRLAWLIVVLAIPIIGGLLYLRLGLRHPGQGEQGPAQWGRKSAEGLPEAIQQVFARDAAIGKGSRLVEAIGGFPATHGNHWHFYGDYVTEDDIACAFHDLVRDIDRATSSCHLLFYIALEDSTGKMVSEALLRATARGVVCRLLVDSLGSRAFLRSATCERLREGGVDVVAAMPVRWSQILLTRFDLRNHRKLVVIDGEIGWTGSQNLADTSFAVKAKYAPWVDVMVRFEGPVVADLQRVFVNDWLQEVTENIETVMTPPPPPKDTGLPVQVLPSGPGAHTRALREVCLLAFLEADEELFVTTPYFVPDEATFSALLTTARSGVRTVLVLPRSNDSFLVAAASRAYYDELLAAGVEIYEFEGLLHSKTVCADGFVTLIATANLDRRSFELNFELNLLVADAEFTAEVRRAQDEYIKQSTRIEPNDWAQRSKLRRGWENIASLVAPVL